MPIDTSTQTGPNVVAAQRVIWNGTPGDKFVNDTSTVLYQFVCDLVNTCGICFQYHMAIGRAWPIPLHPNCRCRQVAIKPDAEAPHAFVDFRQVLDGLDHSQQVAAVGASNYKLIKDGVVTWSDVVTPLRVRDLREVVSNKRLSIDTLTSAGVKPTVAQQAHLAVNTPQHVLIDETRRRLIDQLKGAGLSQAQLVNQIAGKLAERVTIAAGPPATGTRLPSWGATSIKTSHGAILADLLKGFRRPPPPPPAAPPAPEPPPPPPPPSPIVPTTPAAVVPEPEPPPIKKPTKPKIAKPKKGKAFDAHDLGSSNAAVRFLPGAQAEVKRVFGKTITRKKLASLAGAPDGATVVIEAFAGKLNLKVNHPQISSMERTVRKEGDKLIVHNDIFKIKPEFQQNAGKLGLRAFAREVQHAQELGVSHIETYAFRVKGAIDPATGKEQWSGYYVWPRYGYDGPIPNFIKNLPEWGSLPASLNGAQNVSELMVNPIGRAWWQKNGDAFSVIFDLKPDSYSMKTLNSYLKETLPPVK